MKQREARGRRTTKTNSDRERRRDEETGTCGEKPSPSWELGPREFPKEQLPQARVFKLLPCLGHEVSCSVGTNVQNTRR